MKTALNACPDFEIQYIILKCGDGEIKKYFIPSKD